MALSRGSNRNVLRGRVADALSRRLYPFTGVTSKVLAHALGVSPRSVEGWRAGTSEPDGANLLALFSFFDAGFANEVMAPSGCLIAKLSDTRAARAIAQINAGLEELKAMGGAS